MKIAVYSNIGEKKQDKDINLSVFDGVVNPALIHEVLLAQLSNRRIASALTKKRGEVAGGGKKPFKQKGTGRARSGSIRNPLWKGGGTIFGPTSEHHFAIKLPSKKNRAGIVSALISKKENIVILEEVKTVKTKEFSSILKKLTSGRKPLVIFSELTKNNILPIQNIESAKACDYRNLNVFDILNATDLIFVDKALEKTNEFWGAK
jgi:large subunit ribosomal protein L4